MDGLLTFLLFAGFFYLMMRYGCGAHMIHGHSHQEDHSNNITKKFIDPVCGNEVKENQGYSKVFKHISYRFCSRQCLDKFDTTPSLFIKPDAGEK